MYTRGGKINLVIGWCLIPISIMTDIPELNMLACGIFIGGLIKYILE